MMGKAEEGTRSTPSKDGCFIKKKKKDIQTGTGSWGKTLESPLEQGD